MCCFYDMFFLWVYIYFLECFFNFLFLYFFIVFGDYIVDIVIEYYCMDGYILDGNNIIKC